MCLTTPTAPTYNLKIVGVYEEEEIEYQIGDQVTWGITDITGKVNQRYATIIKVNKKTYGIEETTPGWPEHSFNISKKLVKPAPAPE